MISARNFVYTTTVPIRWGDMDAQGHVNNTVYFRYMEQARVEWLAQVRERLGAFPGQGQVIVNASCSFLVPLTYPGSVEIRMFLGAPGRSSIETGYELWKDRRKYAEGAAKLVWIDLETQRSAPLPKAFVELCA
ncbi:MAG: thioesterase family protein [Betaproteobacteria bacterium]